MLAAMALLVASIATLRWPQLSGGASGSAPPEALEAAKREVLSGIYHDQEVGARLAEAPSKLVAVSLLAIWLLPMLVVATGFDTIAGDLQHRTVRYSCVRMRRSSFILGKLAGLVATVAVLLLAMHLLVMVVGVQRGDVAVGDALSWGLGLWIMAMPIALAWSAIAIFVGSFFRAPFMALLAISGVFFVQFFASWVIGLGAHVEWVPYLYPNTYDALMLSHDATKFLKGVLGPFALAGVASGGALGLFTRRDL
jgi:hypothetical protein